MIIKQSLWDLKRADRIRQAVAFVNNKAVPMGFETYLLPLLYIRKLLIIKQSLWDLKHFSKSNLTPRGIIIKQSLWDLKLENSDGNYTVLPDNKAVPMGFETNSHFQERVVSFIIKQSLWDLKPPLFAFFSLVFLYNKAVPMGFETLDLRYHKFFDFDIIKQSLWDLKHVLIVIFSSSTAIIKQSLWDLKRKLFEHSLECHL